MNLTQPSLILTDLTGKPCPLHPQYLTIRSRINRLIDYYLDPHRLSDHLIDLPHQFQSPHQRPWGPIKWKDLCISQIRGIDPALFVQLLAGAAEIESPIRSYSEESWNYLQSLHMPMAHFIGGTYGKHHSIQVVGVWEKEERQHCPALRKMYEQLTGNQLTLKPNSVAIYQPSEDSLQDACNHLFSRIATEWSAISVYLWLMAHSTGALQQAIAQILQDEVNHLAKFWGFSRWAFAGSFFTRFQHSTGHIITLAQHHKGDRSHGNEILSAPKLVNQAPYGIEILFTFLRIMVRVKAWDHEISDGLLQQLFGQNRLTELA